MTAPAVMFCPGPQTTEEILHQLTDPALSLADLARSHHTTVPALSAWMTRPDIQERLAALHSGAAFHARLAAAHSLNAATAGLVTLLRGYVARHAHINNALPPAAPDGHAANPDADPAPALARIREDQSVCRAASLLFRITRFTPLPAAVGTAGAGDTALRAVSTAPTSAPPTTDPGSFQISAPGSRHQPAVAPPTVAPLTVAPLSRAVSTRSTPAPSIPSPPPRAPLSAQAPAPLDLDALAALLDHLGIPDFPEPDPALTAESAPPPVPQEPPLAISPEPASTPAPPGSSTSAPSAPLRETPSSVHSVQPPDPEFRAPRSEFRVPSSALLAAADTS